VKHEKVSAAIVVTFMLVSIFSTLTIKGASSSSNISSIKTPMLNETHEEIVDGGCQQYSHSAASVDIINPLPGHFANYSHNAYYANGTLVFRGWWNTSYLHDVQPHVINGTHTIVRPLWDNGTYWLTIDKTNRWVVNGTHWWKGTWYVAWIETNVTTGSVINWWTSNATISGSQTITIDGFKISTWIINLTYPGVGYDRWYYDKQTGVLVAAVEQIYDSMVNLTLTRTNIPIGQKLLTRVFFNVSPNPASFGQTVTLAGILIDQLSSPIAGEVVRIYYSLNFGISWSYAGSLVTNIYGIFRAAGIPPSTGTYLLAVYFAGSAMYEPSVSFAIMIVL